MEVKTLKGKLQPSQIEWHEMWNGHSCVVRSPEEAIEAVISHVTNHQSR